MKNMNLSLRLFNLNSLPLISKNKTKQNKASRVFIKVTFALYVEVKYDPQSSSF